MTPTTIGLIGIVVLVAMFFTRMPVAYVMTLVGFLGFSYLKGWQPGLKLLVRDMYQIFSSEGLAVIPMFVLMGQLAFNAGIGKKLYDCAYAFIGHVRGGLAMATVAACCAFGTVSGSSPGTAATFAVVGLPEMKRYGYGKRLASGSVASGGSLGILMPPSVVMIVYGILTEQSIGKLFVAGILPALFISLLFIIAIYIYATLSPKEGPAGEWVTWKDKLRSLMGLGDTLVIFAIVMGGLFVGWFTPNEAGAVGAFAVLVVALLTRTLTWAGFVKSCFETLRTSCMVLFLVAGAVIFGHFLTVTQIPANLAGWVSALPWPSWAIVLMIVFVYLVGGCFIDALALIMLTIPVFYPVIRDLGFDPIWFGVIIVLVTQMGVITPPVGINVYVVNGIDKSIPLEDVFIGSMPFLIALIVGTIALVLWPASVLWLPNLMYVQ
jgi:C4-dicarboxylate transporter, DctM subunit